MRWRFIGTSAIGLAAALLCVATDAEAFGRRGRGGGGCASGFSGGSCGGAYGSYAGGLAPWGAPAPAWQAPSWAWRSIGGQLLLEDLGTSTLYAQGNDGVFRALAAPAIPAAAPNGGASRAIAADRASRPQAVYVIDPLTGQTRQVGWLNADGTLRRLNDNRNPPAGTPAPNQ